jgi:tRNA nucleotidyltransferase (CCA-adding enzyme)
MQIYLVGGAVRDRRIGLPVRERDWVVVGAEPAELDAQGYRRVGRSFPVYLHPKTQEEYALARRETKTGPGYRGFEVDFGKEVTLEEDLGRRDLTINAMAEDADGKLIDPYGGATDLENRILRHVSPAFREDPVRILRVARFAARFWALGFRVADETLELMRDMVTNGQADELVPERVWKETETALMESRPDVFFNLLRGIGALAVVFPELDILFGVPQPERWHPEIDTGVHVMMTLQQAAKLDARLEARFAVLVHDLGKGITPREDWPRHTGHEERSVNLIEPLCRRLAVPNKARDLAIHVARYHGLVHRAAELRPQTILKMLDAIDAFRRPERCDDFLIACEADSRGRLGLELTPYPQAAYLKAARDAAAAVDAAEFTAAGLTGEAIGEAIQRRRVEVIAQVKAQHH